MIESTSEDKDHPLRDLKNGLKGQGWLSSRFCQYPQILYIQFVQPVFIKRIDLVIHETNIPSSIKFYSYMPKDKDDYITNYQKVNYDYIGFIRTDTNERTHFQARESRKIYLNAKSLFLKLEFEKNYFNNYNLFNQIGLVKLEFFGDYLPYLGGSLNSNKLILRHAMKRNFSNDTDLDTICGLQLNELKKQMNYNLEIENYLECKEIKNKIELVRLYGKRIFDLESEKSIAINNEDFSKAIEIKNLVDKLKINLQNLDSILNTSRLNDTNLFSDRDNQTIKNKKFSNIPIDLNNNPVISNSYENSVINESIYSTLNDNHNNYNNKSNKNNNSISSVFQDNNLIISEDIFGSHDETILPTVLKKLKNEETKLENEIGEAEKGELEEISPKILKEYTLIANVIGEENMRKIFSKQILWKEEGLIIFAEKIEEILTQNNNSSDIISLILKLSMTLLEEKHPSIVIKTFKIIIKLFELIKKNNIALNIQGSIADGLLTRIKQKLGDVNLRVREKAVSLYCYMLSLNFCDYNNLIAELVELKDKNISKYIPKSSNLILGNLDIFINIFNNFDDAINNKRTDREKFPSFLVMEYLISNVSHNKPEIRKKSRNAIKLFFKIFEIAKFKKNLDKVEEKELAKLIRDIPELHKYFPDITISNNLNSQKIRSNSHNTEIKHNIEKKKVSKLFFKKDKFFSNKKLILKLKHTTPKSILSSKEEKTENNKNKNEISEKNESNNSLTEDNKNNEVNEKIEKDKNDNNNLENNNRKEIKEVKKLNDFCNYCKKKMQKDEVLANHWALDCPMFTRCEKCNINIEVKNLNHHKGNECKYKNEYKLCNNCNEYLLKNKFDSHKNCNLKKGCTKCPLCHKNIPDSDNDFYQHLVTQGCPSQKKQRKA